MGFLFEMIGDSLGDIFDPYSSFGERVLGVLALGMLLLAFLMFFMFAYVAVNTFAVKEIANEKRVVVSKSFTPAHTNTILLLVGKVMVPQITHVPDTYSLCFDFGNVACGDVKKEVYDVAEKGDSFHVSYGVGRLDGGYIIKSIQ